MYHCIPSRLEVACLIGVETKAGEKTGFDHIPRIAYAFFRRAVSRRALTPAVGGTKLVVLSAFGATW
jgi:hypothetical protein